MVLFEKFRRTIRMAKVSTDLEIMLDANTKNILTDFENGKLASELISDSWKENQDLFDGKVDGKPHKFAVIATALSQSFYRSDLSDSDKHLLMVILGKLIQQIDTTKDENFSKTDLKLIEKANKVLIETSKIESLEKIETIVKYVLIRGVPKHTIESASVMQLMSYPEATVITIMDNYKSLIAEGFSENDVINKIENIRSKVNPGIGVPPKNIMEYVIYRIKIEHSILNSLSLNDMAHMKFVVNDYLNS